MSSPLSDAPSSPQTQPIPNGNGSFHHPHEAFDQKPPLVEDLSLIRPATAAEEDAMIHYRLSNDEKHIRRLVKKFHTYLTASRKSTSSGSEDVEVSDARRSFLLELATFQLFVQKCETVCGKEERQVEEYELERETIASQHDVLRQEISELKIKLEEERVFKAKKIEYDNIADKLSLFPSRVELSESISSLEQDISSLKEDITAQQTLSQTRKEMFEQITSQLVALKFLGRDHLLGVESPSRAPTPTIPEGGGGSGDVVMEDVVNPRIAGLMGIGEREVSATPSGGSSALNPDAPPYRPSSPLKHTLLASQRGTPSTPVPEAEEREEGEDIEMGEVEESTSASKRRHTSPGKKARKVKEELEEGEEADSDASSDLTDLPDDD